MKRVFSHIKRLIKKFGFLLFFAFAISPIFGLGVLIAATILSLMLFSDPEEPKNMEDYFTEEELRIIQSEEDVDDEEYLALLAKYQTYECPIKVDPITTWTSSEVTKDSFICHYEINDKKHQYGELDMNLLKNNILNELDKDGYKIQRIVATNRNMIFRYWNCQTETLEDIVISTEELKK